MFTPPIVRSRSRSSTPRTRTFSTPNQEEADQHEAEMSIIDLPSRPISDLGVDTPAAKRRHLDNAFNQTESEIATNDLYVEPKPPFSFRILESKSQTAEIADLKFRLDILTKKHEAKLLEFKLAASKNQATLEKRERKIEDLEKSLVFLNAQEKEYELRIGELQKEVESLKGSLNAAKVTESQLKDEINSLKEKLLKTESSNELEVHKVKAINQSLQIEVNFLNEENHFLKEKLDKFGSELASKDEESSDCEPLTLQDNSTLENLNLELSSAQERCIEVQEENKTLTLKLMELKRNQEEYELLNEKFSTLEQKNQEYENEIYNLQKSLSEVEAHNRTWATFFSKHDEFESVDALWAEYCKTNNQLSALIEKQEQDEDKIQRLEEEVELLKTKPQDETKNNETTNNELKDKSFSLAKLEKLYTFANKELELLRKQRELTVLIEQAAKGESKTLPEELSKLLDEARELNVALAKQLEL